MGIPCERDESQENIYCYYTYHLVFWYQLFHRVICKFEADTILLLILDYVHNSQHLPQRFQAMPS